MKLCADLGFGYNKVAYGENEEVSDLYKFKSVIAEVEVNDLVKDDRVIEFEGKSYYVGDDALALQSNSIIDIDNYEKLEFAAPLFIFKIIRDIGKAPDELVIGLSIAQIKNSGYFKERISHFLKNHGIDIKIKLLPQGMISKLVIDKHNLEFPNYPTTMIRFKNYIGCDIGFNTLDIFQVINGKTSANLTKGIPERGIQVMVHELLTYIKEKTGKSIKVNEGKEVLETGLFKIRNKKFEFHEEIKSIKEKYIKDLMVIIENEFGEILDKTESLILFGGGSYFLIDQENGFIKTPKQFNEFYNVIAYYLHEDK